ncbi:catechol 2,3-dioxygenase-like lactoylglutathione lyase family enzyme [Micromonospora vinacea]|uniref:Catechol 2,3-dioxygenase-like lactoylglutathione lyase family enzyme n=1 Tax=Micromonospora vinacea TaxID=709878 RepID=A0ABS0K9M0_9ACTN|nr:VOC family protein [Micromonospora vinacea]MBG6105337.1 catechol 2,3-dioxygenase-like lactoylglutathione lyase family enzyme [Micromonospora vinacea]
MDFKLEVIVLPVSDVDRARDFYQKVGFRQDVDYVAPDGFRVVHFTPPGSASSIIIGDGVSDAAPGSVQGIHLVVDDVVAARAELVARGIEVSEVFHDAGGVFHHADTRDRVTGPQPERLSYSSFASFSDPDGNGFVLQEVTARQPGRITHVVYGSVPEVEQALRDAAAAHGRHEAELGHEDADWPIWYADYMARTAGLGA